MSESEGFVARHPVATFVTLAYLLAWVWWIPLLADRREWVTWSVSPYLHLVGALGPAAGLIVAAAVRGADGVRALLRACLAWRGRLGWLAAAALGPLASRHP